MIWLWLCLCVLLALLLGALAFANGFVNQAGVPALRKKVRLSKDDRILYVVAHPDDEVLMSGTLSYIKRLLGLPGNSPHIPGNVASIASACWASNRIRA